MASEVGKRQHEASGAVGVPARDGLLIECDILIRKCLRGRMEHDTAYAVLGRIAAALAAPVAPQGQAVAWRYLKHLSGDAFVWTRWLDMDELHHFGEYGDLVKGPAPGWRVEYAYAEFDNLISALRKTADKIDESRPLFNAVLADKGGAT